ncbi:MAG TPA: hypothetical protein VGL88_00265 [Pseudonocardiaceae bacterium]
MSIVSGGPPASARAVSDALAGLGAHAQPLSDAQLAVAEQAEGSAGLVARLSNALYGSALVQVRNAELAAPGVDGGRAYRTRHGRRPGSRRRMVRCCCITLRRGSRQSCS